MSLLLLLHRNLRDLRRRWIHLLLLLLHLMDLLSCRLLLLWLVDRLLLYLSQLLTLSLRLSLSLLSPQRLVLLLSVHLLLLDVDLLLLRVVAVAGNGLRRVCSGSRDDRWRRQVVGVRRIRVILFVVGVRWTLQLLLGLVNVLLGLYMWVGMRVVGASLKGKKIEKIILRSCRVFLPLF